MNKLNSEIFKQSLISGANELFNNLKKINHLNVFPVPDGDTGSNMSMTAESGAEYINKKDFDSVGEISKTFAKGMLMGARGNSGVILSQIFKGLSLGLEKKTTISTNDFVQALVFAKEKAYLAVGNPLEGTILTVIREISEATEKENFSSFPALFDFIIFEGKKSLDNTPNLLKPLKDAGVVDSGGAGILAFFEGMRNSIHGAPVKKIGQTQNHEEVKSIDISDIDMSVNYGYCTEFMVNINDKENFDLQQFEKEFEKYGDSIVVVRDDNILKTHIHSKKPYRAMKFVHQYGEFIKIKIENMSLQVQEQHEIIDGGKVERKLLNKVAIISAAPTKEIAQLMKNDYGVNYVINAKNPSTKEFLVAIEKVDAKNVILVPNNSDALLSAKQARKVEQKSNVYILKTRNVMEGLMAFLQYDVESELRDNMKEMRNSIKDNSTALISIASKSVEANGIMVKAGQAIGLLNKQIICSEDNQLDVLKKVIKNIGKDKEILTIILGKEHDMKMINEFKDYVEDKYEMEVDIIFGNQPVYNYILGVE